MDGQLTAALIAVGAIFLASLGVILKQVPDWISRAIEAKLKQLEKSLETNTALTQESRDLSNGRLSAARNEAQKYQLVAQRYERIVRELNRIPEARPYIDQAAQALRAVEFDTEWDALQQRLLSTKARSRDPHDRPGHG